MTWKLTEKGFQMAWKLVCDFMDKKNEILKAEFVNNQPAIIKKSFNIQQIIEKITIIFTE